MNDFLVVMPITFMPYLEECTAAMHPELKDNLLVIDQTVDNCGAAAAYNRGARIVLDERRDWLITLSPSTRFGPRGGLDLVEFCRANTRAWVIEPGLPVGWHFIAWSRTMFETVGLWDEQFWPVYGEDADIAHRIGLAMKTAGSHRWLRVDVDAWITMQGYSARLAGINQPQDDIWERYRAKWGGRSGHEQFAIPYNGVTP